MNGTWNIVSIRSELLALSLMCWAQCVTLTYIVFLRQLCTLTNLSSSYLIILNSTCLNFVCELRASAELLFRMMMRFVSSMFNERKSFTTTPRRPLTHTLIPVCTLRCWLHCTLVPWLSYLLVGVGSSGPTLLGCQPLGACSVGSTWWALSSWKMIYGRRRVCSPHFWQWDSLCNQVQEASIKQMKILEQEMHGV